MKKSLVVLAVAYGVMTMGVSGVFASSDYVVKKGDTLYSIGQKYEVSVKELKELNGLRSNTIKIGKSLTVSKSVVVKKGDTLYSLAKKNDTTVSKLKELNNLKSNLIFIGQKIVVKGSKETPQATPVVKKGEMSFTLEKHFTYEKEESGKDILQYSKDENYFARIEVLGSNFDMAEMTKNAKSYLSSTGNAQEFKGITNPSFYKGATLHLHASNKAVQQKIVVKVINGQYVKFTIHYPNKEEAESVVPTMLKILNSLK